MPWSVRCPKCLTKRPESRRCRQPRSRPQRRISKTISRNLRFAASARGNQLLEDHPTEHLDFRVAECGAFVQPMVPALLLNCLVRKASRLTHEGADAILDRCG